ncbi:TfoX/Sxy family protein [Actinomycetota bacterium]
MGTTESQDEYAANLELYEKVVATLPEVKRKGKTMPYTSHNGHMFSLLTKEGKPILRLPDKDREAFVKKYGTEPVEQYGAVMKEYVEIPQELLQDTDELKNYFDLSYQYIGTLKPK